MNIFITYVLCLHPVRIACRFSQNRLLKNNAYLRVTGIPG